MPKHDNHAALATILARNGIKFQSKTRDLTIETDSGDKVRFNFNSAGEITDVLVQRKGNLPAN